MNPNKLHLPSPTNEIASETETKQRRKENQYSYGFSFCIPRMTTNLCCQQIEKQNFDHGQILQHLKKIPF